MPSAPPSHRPLRSSPPFFISPCVHHPPPHHSPWRPSSPPPPARMHAQVALKPSLLRAYLRSQPHHPPTAGHRTANAAAAAATPSEWLDGYRATLDLEACGTPLGSLLRSRALASLQWLTDDRQMLRMLLSAGLFPLLVTNAVRARRSHARTHDAHTSQCVRGSQGAAHLTVRWVRGRCARCRSRRPSRATRSTGSSSCASCPNMAPPHARARHAHGTRTARARRVHRTRIPLTQHVHGMRADPRRADRARAPGVPPPAPGLARHLPPDPSGAHRPPARARGLRRPGGLPRRPLAAAPPLRGRRRRTRAADG